MLLGVVVDEALHHPEAGRTVAQHGVGHDRPARALRTPRVPRSRDCTACRAGSPTAVARRAAACRSRAAGRRRVRGTRGTSRSTTTASGRAPRPHPRATRTRASSATGATSGHPDRRSRHERQFIRGQMCPSGSIGNSHSGHLGRPTRPRRRRWRPSRGSARASRTGARRGLRSPRRGRRLVFVGGLLAQLDQHERTLGIEADADQPRPEQRLVLFDSAAAGELAERPRFLRVLLGDAIEELLGLGREQRDLLLLDEHREHRPRPSAPGSRTCAHGLSERGRRRSRRRDRIRWVVMARFSLRRVRVRARGQRGRRCRCTSRAARRRDGSRAPSPTRGSRAALEQVEVHAGVVRDR